MRCEPSASGVHMRRKFAMSSKDTKRRLSIEELTGYTLEELKAAAAPGEPVYDEDNPPLTAEDWEQMRPASELPPEILAAFPNTQAKLRGKQKAPTKQLVSLRLSPDVLAHYKSTGPGWQTRIDEALRAGIKKAG